MNYLYVNQTEENNIETMIKKQFTIPLVNFTKIQSSLMNSDSPIADAFPRWSALSRAYNPLDKKKYTSAIMIAGVSYNLLNSIIMILIEFSNRKKYWSIKWLSN